MSTISSKCVEHKAGFFTKTKSRQTECNSAVRFRSSPKYSLLTHSITAVFHIQITSSKVRRWDQSSLLSRHATNRHDTSVMAANEPQISEAFPTRLCNKIALAARKMETHLGAELKTLDWILYLNIKLNFVSIIDSICHYFNNGFDCFFFLLL